MLKSSQTVTYSPEEVTDRRIDLLTKNPHETVFFSRVRRNVTAEPIPTKLCTSTPWGGHSDIFEVISKLVQGCEIWPLPLTLALASNAHTRENRSRNATLRVLAEGHTDGHTDTNRFYNLSHAICYSYGADKNRRCCKCRSAQMS